MTYTPGLERSALYELLRYGRKHDGPWTEAIAGDQLINEENADLYTAAPDLLEALEGVIDYLYDWCDEEGDSEYNKRVEKCKDAINKVYMYKTGVVDCRGVHQPE